MHYSMKMLRKIILIACSQFLFCINIICGQKFELINLGHCQPSIINSEGFSALKEKFLGKRMVILGEQEHGVGTGYESWSHFIKLLHEELGFNVIALENCFFSVDQMNQAYSQGASAQIFRKALYWPQANSVELNPLLDYLDTQREQQKKVYVEGFDSRVSAQRLYFQRLDSIITHSGIKFYESALHGTYLLRLARALKREYRDSILDTEANSFLSQTDTIIRQLKTAKASPRDIQLFKNLEGFVKNSWNINHIAEFPLQRYHEREKQMFDNLVWLLEVQYPNEKFIILTHNAHGAKNLVELEGHIPDNYGKHALTIGDLLHKRYGEKCLHIATTYYEGNFCRDDYIPISIPEPNANSLESKLFKQGVNYAYIDLTSLRNTDFYMFHNNFNRYAVGEDEIKAKFGRIYDGVIFIKTAKSATRRTQKKDSREWLLYEKLPQWAVAEYKQLKLDTAYEIRDNINPYYLEGDFNGDKKQDIAIFIVQKSTQKPGILIIHANSQEFFIAGAGKDIVGGGDDYSWLDVWKIYPELALKRGQTESLSLKGEGLFVENYNMFNAVIYWTGKDYKIWYSFKALPN